MPLEIFKIVAVSIIAFGLGTTFVEGYQTIEINSLNNRISQLEKQLSDKDKQLNIAQAKAQKQQQLVKEFLQKLEQSK